MMFKKKNKTTEDDGSGCRTVVTETVKTSDGVVQTTKTTMQTSGKSDNMESVFKDFGLDPLRMSGTTVTKKTVYTTATSEHGAICEEKIDKYQTNFDEKNKEESKPAKEHKSLTERLGLKMKNKEQTVGAPTTSSVKPGKFEEDCLKSHNEYRRKHGTPHLKLSKELCAYSKEWADHLAATDKFQHRSEKRHGENIYMKWSSDPNHIVHGHEAVDSWYSEIKDYTFGKEPTSLKSGHFTQVIWKDSSELGVAWARSSNGKVLVVANYSPPGNFVGRFTENVPQPKK